MQNFFFFVLFIIEFSNDEMQKFTTWREKLFLLVLNERLLENTFVRLSLLEHLLLYLYNFIVTLNCIYIVIFFFKKKYMNQSFN